MRNLLISLIFFHLSLNTLLLAQPSVEWQKCLGGSEFEQAACIQQTSDGGYVVAGYTLSNNGDVLGNHGNFDFWVVKLSSIGMIQWQKALGGNDDDRAYSICQSNDGGYLVVGFTQSNNGDVSGNHGDKDAWVVKLSNTGIVEWKKALGGSGWEEAWSVQQTTDGGYILAGRASSNDGDVSGSHAGSLDFWVVKLSSEGVIEWQKCLGGSDEDTAVTVKQTSDGGYIIVGGAKSTDGDVIGNNGNVDFWVVRLDNFGGMVWQNALGGLGLDVASDIFETSDGFIACGYEGSNNTGDVTGHHGFFDYWIVKLNKTGDLQWQKTLGGSGSDWCRNVLQTNDGMYIVSGMTQSSDGDVLINNGIEAAWTIKLNDEGSIVWQKSLGGTQGEGIYSINLTNDGGFIMAGYAWSNDGDVFGNHGGGDFWIVKLSPSSSPTSAPSSAPLEIFPNPATNTISIRKPLDSTQEEAALNMSIYDLLGRELSRQTTSYSGEIDISALPNGLYMVIATTLPGKVFSGKFSKH